MQHTNNTHPAFAMKCLCRTRPHRFLISKPDAETRVETLCTVCAVQLEALGYTTKLVS